MSNVQSPEEFAKLQKVLDLRVMRAKRAYLEKRAEYDALVIEAETLQQEADALNKQYQVLVASLSGTNTVDSLTDITTRRHWLNSDYELKKYYLDIAKDDVEEAEKALLVLKKVWTDADAREQAIAQKRIEAEKRVLAQEEIKTELEQSDSMSVGGFERG